MSRGFALVVFAPILCGGLDADMQDLLKRHNSYRCMHGVPLLTWDAQVADSAQAWVDAATSFEHAGSSSPYYSYGNACGCGENIAGTGGADPGGAVDMWYSEFNSYQQWDLNHFTAMIWKDVKYLGCGVRVGGPAWGGAFVACRYKSDAGLMPNQAGAGQLQVSLTVSKSLSECEQIAAAHVPSSGAVPDDDDGMSTPVIVLIVCASVIACAFAIACMVSGAARRANRKKEAKTPDIATRSQVKQEDEPLSNVREAADAERRDDTADVKILVAHPSEQAEESFAAPDDEKEKNAVQYMMGEPIKEEEDDGELAKSQPQLEAVKFEQVSSGVATAKTPEASVQRITNEEALRHLHESDASRHIPALDSARGKQKCACSCDAPCKS